jgi:N6-adenosine-specific RNA methylase IME4
MKVDIYNTDKKYNIIYADPPWSYNENWGNGAVKHHYETMCFDDIKKLPVETLSEKDCHLYLWVTNPFINEGLALCKAWGFGYKQLITWVKTYKTGEPIMGLGYYFRVCTEHCIFAVKGKLPRINKSLKNLIVSTQLSHSEKPHEFRETIVLHSGDLPRIELFARQHAEGWDCWGNEV